MFVLKVIKFLLVIEKVDNMNIFHIFGTGILVIGMTVANWLGVVPQDYFIPNPNSLGGTFQTGEVRALFTTTLASRITSTDSSMTLSSATDIDGTTLASSTYGFIIDEGLSNEEFVLADCTGTACTNMTRGLSGRTATTSISSLRQEHRRGATVKITDAPSLLFLVNVIKGKQNIENAIRYDSIATTTINANRNNLATAGLVQDAVLSGASVTGASETNYGTVEIATGIETASSTANGSAGRLSIPASLATSTCTTNDSACALVVVVTKNNGKIDDNRISTSTLLNGPITINTTASTTLASTTINGFNPYGLIASTTLSTAASTMTISNIPTRDSYKIVLFASTTNSNTDLYVNFNGDSGANYTWTNATSTKIGQTYWGPYYTYNSVGKFAALTTMDVLNYPTTYKLITSRTTGYDTNGILFGGGLNATSSLMYLNATSRITSITASLTLSGQFTAGSFIKIYSDTSNP
jgi:hypothetical protein